MGQKKGCGRGSSRLQIYIEELLKTILMDTPEPAKRHKAQPVEAAKKILKKPVAVTAVVEKVGKKAVPVAKQTSLLAQALAHAVIPLPGGKNALKIKPAAATKAKGKTKAKAEGKKKPAKAKGKIKPAKAKAKGKIQPASTERAESESFGSLKKVHVLNKRIYIQYKDADMQSWTTISANKKMLMSISIQT